MGTSNCPTSCLSHIMNSLRVARSALRARPTAFRAPLQQRGYADVASDKIRLSLALPHQAIYKSQDVVQVNIPAESGEMGVLASHVPSIEQLKPGLVEIIEEAGGSKQFFLSGGFAPCSLTLSSASTLLRASRLRTSAPRLCATRSRRPKRLLVAAAVSRTLRRLRLSLSPG